MCKEEPNELSAFYHAARRSYAFHSALLILWKIAKIIPSDILNVKLPDIKALPYVLVSLVVYFAFKTTIEWRQSNQQRRNMIPSKMDFAFAHFLGIAAFTFFIFIIDTSASYYETTTQLLFPLITSVALVCIVSSIISICEKIGKSIMWNIVIIILSTIFIIIGLLLTKKISCLSGLLILGVTPLFFAIYIELRTDTTPKK